MTDSRRTFAAFDFDGTLTRRDTLVPFLTTVAGRTAVMRALAAESGGLARRGRRTRRPRPREERVLTRVLAGLPARRGRKPPGRAFGVELARRAITPEARDRIAWHRREGHDVVIVSASLDVYLAEVADALGRGPPVVHESRRRRTRPLHGPSARRELSRRRRRRHGSERCSAPRTSSCGRTATVAVTTRCSRSPIMPCRVGAADFAAPPRRRSHPLWVAGFADRRAASPAFAVSAQKGLSLPAMPTARPNTLPPLSPRFGASPNVTMRPSSRNMR